MYCKCTEPQMIFWYFVVALRLMFVPCHSDFIPDSEIGAIVQKYDDPADACRELVGIAWNRWSESEERTDDITVIVGHIKHSKKRSVFGQLRKFIHGHNNK